MVERVVVSGQLSHVLFNKLSVCHFLDVTMDSVVVEDDNDELIMTTTADCEFYFYHR